MFYLPAYCIISAAQVILHNSNLTVCCSTGQDLVSVVNNYVYNQCLYWAPQEWHYNCVIIFELPSICIGHRHLIHIKLNCITANDHWTGKYNAIHKFIVSNIIVYLYYIYCSLLYCITAAKRIPLTSKWKLN